MKIDIKFRGKCRSYFTLIIIFMLFFIMIIPSGNALDFKTSGSSSSTSIAIKSSPSNEGSSSIPSNQGTIEINGESSSSESETKSIPISGGTIKINGESSSSESEPLSNEDEKASIGTFWWFRGNGGLLYAEDDVTGFANTLVNDGCSWPVDRNSEWNNQPNNNGEFLLDDHLEDGDKEVIDDVDIAYFVGHSNIHVLGINPELEAPDNNVEFYNCRWGDDGPLKWIVLATCFAAHSLFGFSLKGSHLILGYETACDDSLYGPTFADHIKSGMTLKDAWFLTGDQCQPIPAYAKVLGEDLSVANDHLKGYGEYADPSPPDNIGFNWWKHYVNGWMDEYSWINPDNHTNGNWIVEDYAYDNINPNYVNEPESDTFAMYKRGENYYTNSWSEPIVLTVNQPINIQGFRILANHDMTDQIKLEFYKDSQLKTIVDINNWEGGAWKIINFDDPRYQYATNIIGELAPLVNKVKIQFHENNPQGSFYTRPAKISEFDFWELDYLDDDGDDDGNNTENQYYMEAELPSQNTGTMNSYTIVPDEYNAEQFSSIANKLGVTGTAKFVNNNQNPQTYIIENENGKSLRYHTESGVLRYSNPNEKFKTALSEPSIPSDDDAIKIAVDFLRENDLMSDDMTEAIVTSDTQGEGIKDTQEVIYEWVIGKNVYIKKELDGNVLLDKTIISIGDNGQITSFDVPTRSLQLASSVPIKSSETALSDLPNAISEKRGDLPESVNIKNVELGYRIDSLTQNSGIITPYYVFDGKYQESGNNFAAFVSALEE